MMHLIEHMWCRWCGGFGMTRQMVCGDSECLTKDMTDGVLSGLEVIGGKNTVTVQEVRDQATVHYGTMMSAIKDNQENTFLKITAT